MVLAFIVLYLDSGAGLEGINQAKLASLARVVTTLRVPWIAAGDLNVSSLSSPPLLVAGTFRGSFAQRGKPDGIRI